MVALVEIFGYVSANLIALANGWALGVNAAYFTIENQTKHEEDSFFLGDSKTLVTVSSSMPCNS